MLKVIFMGTPKFAVPILDALNNKYEVILVVTQPDKVQGRKQEIVVSPVKEYALSHNLNIVQPIALKDIKEDIVNLHADLIITAAFGQFIPESILNSSKYKPINCHGSLLPKYRGGSPIQTCIKNGDNKTGITIMYMEKKMDAGDILAVKELDILDSDNAETIFDKMSLIAKDLLLDTILKVIDGTIKPIKQNEEEVTFAYNITKEEELLDFNKTARECFNHIRAYYPDPATYFVLEDGLNIKVYDSIEVKDSTSYTPGTLFVLNKKHLCVACGNNTILELLKIKPSGKSLINGVDFINGIGRKYLN